MKNKELTQSTISHYQNRSQDFWEGTKDHDVTQNYAALLNAIETKQAHFNILDFGCGPGRDLKYFSSLGHKAFGLDGCENFCKMAKDYSGCEVYHQDFIELDLPSEFFDGIFANASLFHVPKDQLAKTITDLKDSLVSGGVLFSSNPRGNQEAMNGLRYGNYMELSEYQDIIETCGFKLEHHYYRPTDVPIEQRAWLACVFRKI